MENMINFKEVAEYCKMEVEKMVSSSKYMRDYNCILYVAIMSDESVLVSRTPHILNNAKACILVHNWSELASTIYYPTYKVHFINERGEVSEEFLDENFSVGINAASFYVDPEIYLKFQGRYIYKRYFRQNGVLKSLEDLIKLVLRLYQKCKKECKTQFECELLGRLLAQQEDINILNNKFNSLEVQNKLQEEEIKEYRKLIEQIKKKIN